MGRYPKAVRSAVLKCIACNAPVVETVDGTYVCVECGESPIGTEGIHPETASVDGSEDYPPASERPEHLAR